MCKNPFPKNQKGVFQSMKRREKLFLSHLCEALAAVHRAILAGLEGNSCFLAAGSAHSGEHLTLGLCSVLTGIAAGLASLGLVHETLGCVELLFASGEHEFSAAFFADQSLVFVHCEIPHFG